MHCILTINRLENIESRQQAIGVSMHPPTNLALFTPLPPEENILQHLYLKVCIFNLFHLQFLETL